MRIENKQRVGLVGARGASRHDGSGSQFRIDVGGSVMRSTMTAGTSATAGIDALLALQAADDPVFKRKKQVRRATALLDTLEEMQADLLIGRVSEGRLNQLMMLIGEAREKADPRLDALIDDIELRVRVELAKHGVYPGA